MSEKYKIKMKILNIHDYRENTHNSVYTVLETFRYDINIISPQLDYDSVKPEKILKILHQQIIENKIDIIVGVGLGGFYAAILSAQLDLPVFLVNPYLMPFIYLPRLGYTKDVKPYMTMFRELFKLKKHNISTVVGGQDEIIDTQELTKSILQNTRYAFIPNGKHSGTTLPLKQCFENFLSYIKTTLPMIKLEENNDYELLLKKWYSAKAKKEREEITEKWFSLLENSEYDFDVEEYKILFKKTWQYFMNHLGVFEICREDMEIINYMNRFLVFLNFYNKDNIPDREIYTCLLFLEGLIETISSNEWSRGNRGTFLEEGIIILRSHGPVAPPEIKLTEFEEDYKRFCEYYRTEMEEEWED
ncbi:MAG: YqiA/YcfP family alpha/beta fold hydrolase [Oscillospiraceae bacterium]